MGCLSFGTRCVLYYFCFVVLREREALVYLYIRLIEGTEYYDDGRWKLRLGA